MLYKSILPSQVAERLKNGDNFRFIDVREPIEFEIAQVEGAELFPMSLFNEWIEKLNAEEEIVVMCHHGVRSGYVCKFLMQNGFEKVYNLEGGIDLWSYEVDENVARY